MLTGANSDGNVGGGASYLPKAAHAGQPCFFVPSFRLGVCVISRKVNKQAVTFGCMKLPAPSCSWGLFHKIKR